ncbi:MAG: DUF4301 family protein [Elusimicrobia bacterium]|nr:DUF4301 family protein [Elusimicrobiota bacterium]
MEPTGFTTEDLRQMRERGIPEEEALRQLILFISPPGAIQLNRPCTVGDGILALREAEAGRLIERFDEARLSGRAMRFVPASGAASRMFKALMPILNVPEGSRPAAVAALESSDDPEVREIYAFLQGLSKFAFYEDLRSAMSQNGHDLDLHLRDNRFDVVIEFLLSAKGLHYAGLPKALMKFHRYPEGGRTAFEEHLVEAAGVLQNRDGLCRLHFTVSPEHAEDFQSFARVAVPRCEKRFQCRYLIGFSVQDRSTDTLAVDLDNRPFRLADGRLLFRPGGHGALLQNLNDVKGDIVFVKNVDNVTADRLKPERCRWEKILGGLLVDLQEEAFQHLRRLRSGPANDPALRGAVSFAEERLSLVLPPGIKTGAAEDQRRFVMEKLDRPIRLCGVVRNTGEPGGGPFWVRGDAGDASLQIVEGAQVDPASPEQQEIFAKSTHFNPVNMVCGLRDAAGRPYDLTRHVDPQAVFISQKTQDGRPLKALERPGLWNGGMARWNTVFVEVPVGTFHPAKTVNDLLREGHQNETSSGRNS